MFHARVVDEFVDDDGSDRHSQDADELGAVFSDLPIEKEAHNTLLGGESSPANGSSTEKTTVEESRHPWPDLILDLVSDMLHRLSFVNHLSATNAIPSWRQAVEKQLGPCLLSFANDNKTCTISGMLHDFKETSTTPDDMPANIQILSSKHGWLLLMGEVNDTTYSIFFYNPTSQSIMKLPPSNVSLRWYHFSFTAPPDSPNCVVIASLFSDDWKRLAICEKGHSEWTLMQEDKNLKSFEMQYMSPVFHKGRFYWIGNDGRVSEFDLLTRSWAVHGKDMCLCPSTFRFYLVESDDELFFVWSSREGDTIRIYKFNLDNIPNIWSEIYNLGGRCFFVGFNACVSLSTRVLSCKEEKIYFQMLDQAQEVVYYSV